MVCFTATLTRLKDFTSYIYVPPNVPMKYSDWPTLGEMIDSGKRVVMFLDAGADTTKVDFILPEFQMVRYRSPLSRRLSTLGAYKY